MANYYGVGRTNYFAVKDGEAFKADMAALPVEVITREDENGETLYGFMDANPDGAGLDWSRFIELEDENGEPFHTDIDIDWTGLLASHLKDGWVAIIMETGAEKYRYMMGYAIAVNSKGETREVNLDREIMRLSEELGSNVTAVGY